MKPCEQCSEFQSQKSELCPICEFKATLRAFQREFAIPVLTISDGKIKHIKEARDITHTILQSVFSFFKLELPSKAIPVGYEEFENVQPLALNLYKIAWKDCRHFVQDICYMLLKGFPELGKDHDLSKLFKIGYKQVGFAYHSEYMFSVQSSYRLPMYMQSIGFQKIQKINLTNVDLEITSGYYSYLRCNKQMPPAGICLHHIPIDISFNSDWQFRRGKNQFALSYYKSSTEVAHFIGPENDLLSFFKEFLPDDWAVLHGGSMINDLEDAVKIWWTDKSKLSYKSIKPDAM